MVRWCSDVSGRSPPGPRANLAFHLLPRTRYRLGIRQLTALEYRNPRQVDAGEVGADEVLVVGASASGTQIADELQRSGTSA